MANKNTKATAAPMSDMALELIANRFRALSEPMRLKILNYLMQGESAVGHIVDALGTSQANVSKHLSILREAGMVSMRKNGLSTVCSIGDPIVKQLCEMMCSQLREEMEQKATSLAFDPQI